MRFENEMEVIFPAYWYCNKSRKEASIANSLTFLSFRKRDFTHLPERIKSPLSPSKKARKNANATTFEVIFGCVLIFFTLPVINPVCFQELARF